MSWQDNTLAKARTLDIDECEVIRSRKKITTIRITDSEIAEVKQINDESFGVRIIDKNRIVSCTTNKTDEVEKTLEGLQRAAKNIKPHKFWMGLSHELKHKTSLDNTFDAKLDSISEKEAMDISQEMINSADHDKVSSISGSLNIVSENFQISNSNGLYGNDEATYIAGVINSDSEEGIEPVSGIGQFSCRTLSEFKPGYIGNRAAEMCVESINPTKCETSNYTIILEPYSVGELLTFVFAPNFSLKTYSEKKSCFSESLGKEMAVKELDVYDDPTVKEGLGTKPFDEEGINTKKLSIIKEGKFMNTYSNLYDSYEQEASTTGNAVRSGSPMGRSAEGIPISAPHNLRIKKGDYSLEEMIKETKKGLLVGRLWYTYAVNPIKGDFSCTARSGIRLIENGKIKSPAKQVRIVHNLRTFLKNISSIENVEKNVIQWASAPSTTPSIKVENVSVKSF